ncbi:uncharacterized protein LOC127714844 [Mytilus californianus]|uniref:uncharacterized protein LOC127714844 n=1 Tax=Mytilus californianus TaxID=6549 RepID=UPI002246F750|nr:uncharacterized protein LOC127714844 [Mytilus californianus]
MSELENLQINWNWIDPSSTKSIDEFFDMFSNINADLPPLDADLIKMMDYLNANLTFDTSVKELEQENHVKVREYLVENFLPKVDADSDEELMKTVGSSSRVLIYHIEAGRHDFQNDLKEILYDLLLTSRTVEEMRFTTMLEKFCRMCNLKGRILKQIKRHLEEIKVTFSYFQCNTVQFEEIMTGNQCVNSPVVYYSRPYNYLKAADRKELITPLLTLGFVQFSPCCISRKEQQIENVD